MSDIFNRMAFEQQLSETQSSTMFSPAQDSATIRQLKNTFRMSSITEADFDINPFEFNHIQDWFNALNQDYKQSDYEYKRQALVSGDSNIIKEEGTTDSTQEPIENTKFFSASPADRDQWDVAYTDPGSIWGICTPPLNPTSEHAASPSIKQEPSTPKPFVAIGPFISSPAIADEWPSGFAQADTVESPFFNAPSQHEPSPVVKEVPVAPRPERRIGGFIISPSSYAPSHHEPTPVTKTEAVAPRPERRLGGFIVSPRSTNPSDHEATPFIKEESLTPKPLVSTGPFIDFQHQEPDYEHAIDPVVPLPGPTNFQVVRPHTPIVDRRLAKAKQQYDEAVQSVNSLEALAGSVKTTTPRSSKKRSANEARTPRSAIDEPKRVRLSTVERALNQIDEVIDLELNRPQPVPEYVAEDEKTPCSANFSAYPGQFHGVTTDYLAKKTKSSLTTQFFGTVLNANGIYANTSTPALLYQQSSPSQSSHLDLAAHLLSKKSGKASLRAHGLPRAERHLLSSLESKADLATAAHVACHRSAIQDLTRYRLHQEASESRLEGVAVGRWRYENGAMTTEEYLEAGVCVCWEPCACAAFCGRFPDMMCPCTEHIVVLGDDEK